MTLLLHELNVESGVALDYVQIGGFEQFSPNVRQFRA